MRFRPMAVDYNRRALDIIADEEARCIGQFDFLTLQQCPSKARNHEKDYIPPPSKLVSRIDEVSIGKGPAQVHDPDWNRRDDARLHGFVVRPGDCTFRPINIKGSVDKFHESVDTWHNDYQDQSGLSSSLSFFLDAKSETQNDPIVTLHHSTEEGNSGSLLSSIPDAFYHETMETILRDQTYSFQNSSVGALATDTYHRAWMSHIEEFSVNEPRSFRHSVELPSISGYDRQNDGRLLGDLDISTKSLLQRYFPRPIQMADLSRKEHDRSHKVHVPSIDEMLSSCTILRDEDIRETTYPWLRTSKIKWKAQRALIKSKRIVDAARLRPDGFCKSEKILLHQIGEDIEFPLRQDPNLPRMRSEDATRRSRDPNCMQPGACVPFVLNSINLSRGIRKPKSSIDGPQSPSGPSTSIANLFPQITTFPQCEELDRLGLGGIETGTCNEMELCSKASKDVDGPRYIYDDLPIPSYSYHTVMQCNSNMRHLAPASKSLVPSWESLQTAKRAFSDSMLIRRVTEKDVSKTIQERLDTPYNSMSDLRTIGQILVGAGLQEGFIIPHVDHTRKFLPLIASPANSETSASKNYNSSLKAVIRDIQSNKEASKISAETMLSSFTSYPVASWLQTLSDKTGERNQAHCLPMQIQRYSEKEKISRNAIETAKTFCMKANKQRMHQKVREMIQTGCRALEKDSRGLVQYRGILSNEAIAGDSYRTRYITMVDRRKSIKASIFNSWQSDPSRVQHSAVEDALAFVEAALSRNLLDTSTKFSREPNLSAYFLRTRQHPVFALRNAVDSQSTISELDKKRNREKDDSHHVKATTEFGLRFVDNFIPSEMSQFDVPDHTSLWRSMETTGKEAIGVQVECLHLISKAIDLYKTDLICLTNLRGRDEGFNDNELPSTSTQDFVLPWTEHTYTSVSTSESAAVELVCSTHLPGLGEDIKKRVLGNEEKTERESDINRPKKVRKHSKKRKKKDKKKRKHKKSKEFDDSMLERCSRREKRTKVEGPDCLPHSINKSSSQVAITHTMQTMLPLLKLEKDLKSISPIITPTHAATNHSIKTYSGDLQTELSLEDKITSVVEGQNKKEKVHYTETSSILSSEKVVPRAEVVHNYSYPVYHKSRGQVEESCDFSKSERSPTGTSPCTRKLFSESPTVSKDERQQIDEISCGPDSSLKADHRQDALISVEDTTEPSLFSTPTQKGNIPNCFSRMPCLTILCSERFLQTFGMTIAQLSSGRWTDSFFLESPCDESLLGQERSILSERMLGRKISVCDTNLLDALRVDFELPGRKAIIVCPLSVWSQENATSNKFGTQAQQGVSENVKSFIRDVVELSASGRYVELHILLAIDLQLSPSTAEDISALQNALVRQNGCPCELISFQVLLPDFLSSAIAQKILVDSRYLEKNTSFIESFATDMKIQEQVRFCCWLVPTLGVYDTICYLANSAYQRKLKFRDVLKEMASLTSTKRNRFTRNRPMDEILPQSAYQLTLALNTPISAWET